MTNDIPRNSASSTATPGSRSNQPQRTTALALWLVVWVVSHLFGPLFAAPLVDRERPIGGALALASVIGVWLIGLAGSWWALTGSFRVDEDARRRWRSALRVRFRPIDIPIGLSVGLALHWAVFGLYWIVGRFVQDLDLERPARALFDASDTTLSKVALVVMVGVGAPIFEEVMYRGWLFRALESALETPSASRERSGLLTSTAPLAGRLGAVALVGSAGIFAAVHFQVLQFAGLFVVGLALGLIVRRTHRLGGAVVAHATFNLLTVLVLFGVDFWLVS